jgi:hypothetical protein
MKGKPCRQEFSLLGLHRQEGKRRFKAVLISGVV